MAVHKKHPIFIRVRATEQDVVCINPRELSSFQIIEEARVRTNVTKENPEGEVVEADTIRFYFPAGTHLSYSVGIDLTREEFDYVSYTLREFLYLNYIEFQQRGDDLAAAELAKWNKMATEGDEEAEAMVKPPVEAAK